MAAYFWVGGTGTWSGTGNTQFAVTSGGVPTALNPTNADTVTFDTNSGTAATVTCTSTAVSLSTTINKADINLSLSGSPTLCTAAGTCTLTAGTLTLNTFTLSTGLFNSNNSNTRVLAFGTGNITLTGVSTTIFDTTTVTNMTITGTPVVNCTATTGTSVQTRIFIAGNHGEAQAISVNINPGTSAVDIFRFATNSGAFKDVTFSNTFTGTIQISNTIIFYGSVSFGGATVYTGNSTLTFAATSGTKTIRTSGLTIDAAITFNGVGGSWQLQDALTSGATRTATLTNGTLDLASYTLTTGFFSSSNSNTRVLAFGTGKIVLTGTSGSIWTTSTSTNLTVTGTNPLIEATAGGAGTRTITMGAAGEANAISLDVTSGSDIVTLATTNGAYKNVNFTGFSGTFNLGNSILVFGNWNFGGVTAVSGTAAVTFSATSGTKTVTSNGVTFPANVAFNGIGGTWACQDALSVTGTLTMTNGTLQLKSGATSTVGAFATSGTNAKYLLSTTFGTAATISDASGTNTVQYLTVQDSIATGGAIFDALAITNVDAGNNTGWLFSTTPSIGNEITMRLRSFTQPRRF